MFSGLKLRNIACYPELVINLKQNARPKKMVIFFGKELSGKRIIGDVLSILVQSFKAFEQLKKSESDPYFQDIKQTYDWGVKRKEMVGKFDKTGSLLYECILGRITYVYYLEFNKDGLLTRETFKTIRLQQEHVIFDISRVNIYLSSSEFREWNRSHINQMMQHWGSVSMLSAMMYWHHSNHPKWKFHHVIKQYLSFLGKLVVLDDQFCEFPVYHVPPFLSLLEGLIEHDKLPLIMQLEELMSLYLQSIFPQISRLKYHTVARDRKVYYALRVECSAADERRLQGYIRHLCLRFECLLWLNAGYCTVFTDFDTQIDQFPLRLLFELCRNHQRNQFLLSAASDTLLQFASHNSVYFTYVQNQHHHVNCMADLAVTQTNHNNRKRYEAGFFFPVEKTLSKDISKLLHELSRISIETV